METSETNEIVAPEGYELFTEGNALHDHIREKIAELQAAFIQRGHALGANMPGKYPRATGTFPAELQTHSLSTLAFYDKGLAVELEVKLLVRPLYKAFEKPPAENKV